MTAQIATRDVTVELADGPVVFRVHETGADNDQTLLLLHGSGPGANALSNWEWVIGELGDGYHCVAPDVVGFGDSTHPDPPPVGMKAMTEWRVGALLGLIDELELSNITLVGNSMGGLFSLFISSQRPDLARRLILMGSAGGKADILPGLQQMMSFYDDPTAEAMEALLQLFLHDPSIFGGDLRSIAEARLPNALRPEVERSHRATFNFAHGPARLGREDFGRITMPTLLLHGDDDRVVSIESSKWLAEVLPNATLDVFPDTGHWLQIESGPAFVAAVNRFCEEN